VVVNWKEFGKILGLVSVREMHRTSERRVDLTEEGSRTLHREGTKKSDQQVIEKNWGGEKPNMPSSP